MPETNVVPLDRTPDTVKVDNLIRRALKVRDPTNETEIASALLNRYPGESERLRFERIGAPWQSVDGAAIAPKAIKDLDGHQPAAKRALDGLEQDLKELLGENQLKDITPELQGWARALRTAASDGLDAARAAIDPLQRDRALSARRVLSEYALVARYVGALSGGVNPAYRRVAQSLDAIAASVLVALGDGLAASGITRSAILLPAPASSLIERRDAVISSLRSLVGTTEATYGGTVWPRGLLSYSVLLQSLDAAGQSDLRTLLEEANLARVLDELIDLAAGNTPDGLRALGATFTVSINRLHRLANFCQSLGFTQVAGSPPVTRSPPLASFAVALNLFVDSFRAGRSGLRILAIGRPVLGGRTGGVSGGDPATRLLLSLAQERAQLGELADCYLGCECGEDRVRCQVMLDRLVYGVDRAIDLYALGVEPRAGGQQEIRAKAYGALIARFLIWLLIRPSPARCLPIDSRLLVSLHTVQTTLGWPNRLPQIRMRWRSVAAQLMYDELAAQVAVEDRLEDLVARLTPQCLQERVLGTSAPTAPIRSAVRRLIAETLRSIGLLARPPIRAPSVQVISVPQDEAESLDSIDDQVRRFIGPRRPPRPPALPTSFF